MRRHAATTERANARRNRRRGSGGRTHRGRTRTRGGSRGPPQDGLGRIHRRTWRWVHSAVDEARATSDPRDVPQPPRCAHRHRRLAGGDQPIRGVRELGFGAVRRRPGVTGGDARGPREDRAADLHRAGEPLVRSLLRHLPGRRRSTIENGEPTNCVPDPELDRASCSYHSEHPTLPGRGHTTARGRRVDQRRA